MIVLPAKLSAHHLRTEGARFGEHKAAHADKVMRQAHEAGLLTEQVNDQILAAVDHDIRKTVEDLAKQVPPAKLVIFDKAARRAYRHYAKAKAAT